MGISSRSIARQWLWKMWIWRRRKRRRGIRTTYNFIMLLANLLAHELAHPVIITAVLGLQTGNYERHVEGTECSFCKKVL
jgi:hypothetical protein